MAHPAPQWAPHKVTYEGTTSKGGVIYVGRKRVIINFPEYIQDEEKHVHPQWSSNETTYLMSNYRTICAWLLYKEHHMVSTVGFSWTYKFMKHCSR